MPCLSPSSHVQCLSPSTQASGPISHKINLNEPLKATNIATSLQPDSAPHQQVHHMPTNSGSLIPYGSKNYVVVSTGNYLESVVPHQSTQKDTNQSPLSTIPEPH